MTDAIRGIPLIAQDSLDFVIIVAAVLEGLRRHAAALVVGTSKVGALDVAVVTLPRS